MRLFKLAALPCLLSIAACGGGGETGETSGPLEGEDSQYVVNQILLPTTNDELRAYSHDLDNDKNIGNKIGAALKAVKERGNVDLQVQLDKAVNTAEVVLLVNARASSKTSAKNSGSWLLIGDKAQIKPAPCVDPNNVATCGKHLTGSGTFAVDADLPTDALLRGKVVNGTFEGGPGDVVLPLSLSADAAPIPLHLTGAHTRFTFDAGGGLVGGMLAGGITVAEMDQTVLPAVYQLVASLIARDCTGGPGNCCTANSTGGSLLGILDPADDDCEVTEEQFKNQPIIKGLLGPDLNLFNGEAYDPGVDNTLDAVSIGLGFTAVPGSFSLPANLRTE